MRDPNKICGVAGVEPSSVGMRCRCNQEIHHPGSRLAASVRNRGGELPIADRHVIVDRESVELPLEGREPPQSLRPDCRISSDQHAEVKFSERGGASYFVLKKTALGWRIAVYFTHSTRFLHAGLAELADPASSTALRNELDRLARRSGLAA